MIAAAEEMCPEIANLFKNINISANIGTRKVDNITENILTHMSDRNTEKSTFMVVLLSPE